MLAKCQTSRVGALCFASLTVLAITFFACRKSLEPVSPFSLATAVNGIIPFEVGFQWRYRMSIYDTTGQLLSTGEYTTEIVRDTTILGERWFIDNAGSVSTNRDGETWTMRARVPYLTFTKTLGDSAFIRGDVWIKLVGTSDRIVVPAGEFTGYRYNEVHWKVSDEYAIYHIVPRKGVVKTVVRSMTLRGGTYIAYTTELVWTNVP